MTTALVTGAAQGLGRAIARRLAADGHQLVVLDLNAEGAEETAALVGGRAVECDVTDRAALASVAAEVGPIDVLINNAGIWRFGPILEASAEDLEDVVRVNLLGTVNACQAFTPTMGPGSSIVNFSSAAAAIRAPGVGIYTASKGALEVLTQQLAGELGPRGIRVNAIAPGLIVTEGTAVNYQAGRQEERAKTVPLRRVGEPADIANVVSFLVSDQASYVTGQIVAVDGGIAAARVS